MEYKMEHLTRISHNIDIMGGKACINGTRVTVGMLLTQISEGKTIDELLNEYPYLVRDDIMQALMYAAWTLEAREGVFASV
jgi:uncharacterized protein (DUF433 family)